MRNLDKVFECHGVLVSLGVLQVVYSGLWKLTEKDSERFLTPGYDVYMCYTQPGLNYRNTFTFNLSLFLSLHVWLAKSVGVYLQTQVLELIIKHYCLTTEFHRSILHNKKSFIFTSLHNLIYLSWPYGVFVLWCLSSAEVSFCIIFLSFYFSILPVLSLFLLL